MGEGDFLSDEWLQAQREYWAQWAARAGTGEAGATPSPWEQALDQWWRSLAPAPPQVQELLEKTLAQGRQLFQLAGQFAASGAQAPGEADWQAIIQQTFGELRGIIAGLAGSMNPLPETAADGVSDYLQRLSALPGLGLEQGLRVQQRELAARLLRYQKACQAYEQFLVELGNRSASRLQEALAGLEAEGGTIDSARALYELWVSTCEKEYAEQVMTTAYVELYGELINSQMALKQQMRALLDETLTLLGMPSSGDFRALERRAHQDRQALRALQTEVEALRHSTAPPPKRARTRKKTAATGS